MAQGEFTYQEIDSQPAVWGSALAAFLKQAPALAEALADGAQKTWLVTGCGSTHYASIAAAAYLRRRGIRALPMPASDIVFFPEWLPREECNLLAISRSGTTTETLWAIDRFRKAYPGGKVVSDTTQPGSPMAQASDHVIAAVDAQEKSVAQTRSFTSMVLLALAFGGLLREDDGLVDHLGKLPEALRGLIRRVGALPRQLGEDRSLQRFFFLGGGPNYGLACEAMLKTKEMTRSWAEAYHPLEFRHGPMSVVNDETLVVGLISDSEQEAELRVLRDMQKLGARILALVEDASKLNWSGIEYVVELKSGLTEWERGPIYLPFIQWMDYYRTLDKGLDPDKPVNLTAVVNL